MNIFKYIFWLLNFLYSITCLSQNLVLNPSFEQQVCDDEDKYYWSYIARDWRMCNSSLGYYGEKTCKGENPFIFPPIRKGHTGKCYVAIGLYSPEWGFRGFLRTKLKEPLIKDEYYIVGFYIMLAPASLSAVKNIGVNFSKTEINCDSLYDLKYASVEHNHDYYLTDSINWMLISMTYKAVGGEQFMTISRFTRNYISDSTQVTKFRYNKEEGKLNYYDISSSKGKTQQALYFIDDVFVIPEKDYSSDITKTKLEKGKLFTLNNIFFDTNKSEFLSTSYSELDKLTELLKSNPSLSIVIRGHTDNTGTEEHNQQLSIDRANAVMNYLIKKGIAANRLSTWGFGSTRPLTSNVTEEGKAMNRRVEIQVK